IWVSFLVQQVADPDMGTSYAVAALGQGLTFGSHAMDGGVTGTTASVGSFYTAGGAQNANAAIAANSVSLIALRYDFASSGNDTISMWINPLLDAPLGAPDASGAFKNYASAFTGVTLAYGDYKPFVYDELRIGSSFSAVTAVTAVPEPQSFALLLAGLGAIALLRRRLG
ncbi:MAG: PEP-CTERM sorting domain-containing protein, partial [Rubrivivax sp.]